MPSSLVRPYLGEAAETRVAARRRRLVDAAFERMANEGWRTLTIDALCKEAKLNKRYFYESFSDLDAVAGAVVEELAGELLRLSLDAAMESRASGESTERLARRVLGIAIDYLLDDPRRARVLFTEIADSPQARRHRQTAIHGLSVALSEFGHVHHEARGDTDPIAPLAASLLVGGSIEAVLGYLDGTIDLPRELFVDDLASLWVVAGDQAVARARARRPGESTP